jgi:hypothetical protein
MHPAIRTARRAGTWLLARLTSALVVGAFAGRLRDALRGRGRTGERADSRRVLPSLLDTHPEATRAPRRAIGIQGVPVDSIVGTMRHPSQNTADFLPLPRLRGENWRARWQRITRATDRLAMLPPVDLVRVGDEYYVADGHNRVAAARQAGAAEIDADVTQLVLPGITAPMGSHVDTGALIGSQSVRRAAEGRITRTVEQRTAEDHLTRADLLRDDDRHVAERDEDGA